MTEHGESPTPRELLANTAIVLVEPKYPENIGAAARIAMNMGIPQLVLVRREEPDAEKMLKMATHKAASLIESMARFETVAEALAPFTFAVGTTARLGRQRRQILPPREAVAALCPQLANNRVALLFGPEHRGLTNDDLLYCNLLTSIPTMDFSSLNLAQAVALYCYELNQAVHAMANDGGTFVPKLATSRELEGMYGHLSEMLRKIEFLKAEDRDDYWMRTIRQFLGRVGLRTREVKAIRGFCRQFLWFDEQRRK